MEGVTLKDIKRLRACFKCRLIKSEAQWKSEGSCQNCIRKDNNYDVFEYTTPHFEGLLAICKPRESWLSRYQQLSNKVPGLYCLKVHGEVPENLSSDDYDDN